MIYFLILEKTHKLLSDKAEIKAKNKLVLFTSNEGSDMLLERYQKLNFFNYGGYEERKKAMFDIQKRLKKNKKPF